MNQAVLGLLKLEVNKYKVESIEEIKIDKKNVKIIKIKCISKKQRCPICNKFTSSVHDTLKSITLKHTDVFGYQSKILLTKRRFICHKCNKKFTEPTSLNQSRCNISNEVKKKIRKDLLNYNLSMKYIAEINNVSDVGVRNELKLMMKDYSEFPNSLPRVISFDEFKADTSYGKYAFIMNDPIHKKTLDVLPSRKKEYLMNYFTKINNRQSVEYVISDMYEPYLIVTNVMFPKAKYVVDRFHYIRYIMDALDNIRIRLQEEFGISSKEYKLLKNRKNVSLLRIYFNDVDNWYTYTKRYKNGHMVDILKIDILDQMLDLDDELKRGYHLKELFLDIVNHATYETAKSEIESFIDLCKESKIDEFIEASKTIENWLPYIVNSFIDKRFSNGYTEGLNNKIKVIKRVGFGYKNFYFFRLRLLYILNGKIIGKK